MSPFYFHGQIIVRHVPCDARLTLRLWVLLQYSHSITSQMRLLGQCFHMMLLLGFVLLEGLLRMK